MEPLVPLAKDDVPGDAPTARKPLLTVNGVSRVFGRGNAAVWALKEINLSIQPGKLVALKGRSGSGKTTLINLIGGLDNPTGGTIRFDGTNLGDLNEKQRTNLRRKTIGLVFQSFGLMPLMSAYENVEFGLRIAGVPIKKQKAMAEEALDAVGLKNRMGHRPFEMSGGEQQRVAIARAISHRPKLILADEPTAELDTRTGLHIMKVFRDLVQQEAMTIILTTHDPAIMEIVDHVFELEDGKIVETES